MKILILEDNEDRIIQFKNNFALYPPTVVENANDAIKQLTDNKWDVLFLDHDLGGSVHVSIDEKNTGSEVARFLKKNPDKIPGLVILHSLNIDGRKNMKMLIPSSIMVPFAWDKLTDVSEFEPSARHLWDSMAKKQSLYLEEYGRG